MKIAVIGSGSWGTAVSWLLGNKGHEVMLWAHTQSTADAINATHRNPRYLVDIELPNVSSSSEYAHILAGVQAVVLVTPSNNIREAAKNIQGLLDEQTPVVVLSKGVERETGLLLTDVCSEVLGNPDRIAALAGPNHAEEVSLGIPAATVVASTQLATAEFFQDVFMTPKFRVYTSVDVTGVELCAAAKNIIAIATGIATGMGYGDNTAAMLMTRGLAEMSRLTRALGGDPLTCMGLAGMGDLVATCTSKHSRNRTLGTIIASGGTLDDFAQQTHMVAEGAYAALSVTDLANKHGVDLPLSWTVREILWEGLRLDDAFTRLLSRSPKYELAGLD